MHILPQINKPFFLGGRQLAITVMELFHITAAALLVQHCIADFIAANPVRVRHHKDLKSYPSFRK